MSKLLRPPQSGSSLTDKDGKPTSHHYRWMDGVTETVSELDKTLNSSTSALNTSIATTNSNLSNLSNTVSTLSGRQNTKASGFNLTTNPASFYDFSNIPSWVNRISIYFSGVTATGTVIPVFQLGTASGIDANGNYTNFNRGYVGNATVSGTYVGTSSATDTWFNGEFPALATTNLYLQAILFNLDGLTWSYHCHTTTANTNNSVSFIQGRKTLSSSLTTLRIASSAASTFNAGLINIFYE